MDFRNKLAEYGNDITRWEKVTYREVQSPNENKHKSVRGKRSVLYVDVSLLRHMMKDLSLVANKIAYTIMDECHFGTNLYYATYEEIEQAAGIADGSVIKGMRELQSVDFIRKVKNARWMLNPAVGSKCYQEDVNKLMDIYATLKQYEPKIQKGDKIDGDVIGQGFGEDDSFQG